MLKSMVMLIVAVGLGVCGQLAMKSGVTRAGDLQTILGQSVWRFAATVVKSPLIILGLFLYGISTIFWLLVLSRVDLSLAYPMIALGYVFVLLVSIVFLGEKVNVTRWLGTALIVLGVVLNASTAKGS